ncbi:MAG TPA: hypothetical protein EYP87_03235 [Flavobacteriaceae bacterium]|nr:hypothetical protein [Flavobacteriaceae bacterium]
MTIDNILTIIQIFIIISIGLIITKKTASKIKSTIVYVVYFEHLVFTILYYLFALKNTTDATGYFNRAVANDNFLNSFGTGTDFIDFVSTFFIKYLYYSQNYLYSFCLVYLAILVMFFLSK